MRPRRAARPPACGRPIVASPLPSGSRARLALPSVLAGDMDGNGRLSYTEFAKVLGRMPDFTSRFRMYIG